MITDVSVCSGIVLHLSSLFSCVSFDSTRSQMHNLIWCMTFHLNSGLYLHTAGLDSLKKNESIFVQFNTRVAAHNNMTFYQDFRLKCIWMFKKYRVCILSAVTGHHLFYEYTYIFGHKHFFKLFQLLTKIYSSYSYIMNLGLKCTLWALVWGYSHQKWRKC